MRIVDTPITELGFAGIGVGAAMVGLRPVIEFMTWNFALLAIDQIVNSPPRCATCPAARSASRSCSAAPAAPRSSWRAALPGVRELVRPHPRPQGGDARHARRRQGAAQGAIRDDDPVVFIEGEMLYNLRARCPRASTSSRSARRRSSGRAPTSPSSATPRPWRWRSRRPSSSRRKGSRPRCVDLRTIRPLDTDDAAGIGGQDPPLRRGRGGLALRGRRGPGGGRDPAGRLRRSSTRRCCG